MNLKMLSLERMADVMRYFLRLPNPPTQLYIGKPGLGKSATATEVGKAMGKVVFYMSLGRIEPYDVKGLPALSGEYMVWKQPEFWARVRAAGEKAMVIFDEVTHATESVQAAILDAVNEKQIDGDPLPKGMAVVMLGNAGGDDGTFARALSTALINRCATFGVAMPSIQSWIDYVKPRKEVAKFVETYDISAFYVSYEVEAPLQPWTSPRSMDMFNRAVAGLDFNKPEDVSLSCILAGGFLHPSTAELWDAYINTDQLSPAKLWKGDASEWSKYKKTDDPALKAVVLKDVLPLVYGIDYMKTTEQRETLKPKLQKFLQHLIDAEGSQKDGKLCLNDVATAFFHESAKGDTQLFMDITLKDGGKDVKAASLLSAVWTNTFKGKGGKGK